MRVLLHNTYGSIKNIVRESDRQVMMHAYLTLVLSQAHETIKHSRIKFRMQI